jgi:hypothetical protein
MGNLDPNAHLFQNIHRRITRAPRLDHGFHRLPPSWRNFSTSR